MAKLVKLGEVAEIRQGLSTSGRGAGKRPGNWQVRVISVGSLQEDRLVPDGLETLTIEQNVKTEKHLLETDDLLVTARSTLLKAALVPPLPFRAVADATLLVLRPRAPEMGPYLWWFLTSSYGRQLVQARMTGSTTLLSLTATNLGEVDVPLPAPHDLNLIAELVEASERAYGAAIEAARLRRTLFRDETVQRLLKEAECMGENR